MTKYVLNIIFSDNSHNSLTFDTYEEADKYLDWVHDTYELDITWYDINEVEV